MSTKTAAALAATAMLSGGAIPAAAALSDGAHAAGSHSVVLQHNHFLPGAVSIRRGESVTWVWHDGHTIHNVIGSGFASHVMNHGTFTVRFTHSGIFRYKCTIHPHMGGTVVVH